MVHRLKGAIPVIRSANTHKLMTVLGAFAVAVVLALAAAGVSSSAAFADDDVAKWKITSKKVTCKVNGKQAKGFTAINGKTYYFDKKGKQHTGWQEIDGAYYFFKVSAGKGGYMVTKKVVNGVYLNKYGVARVTTTGKKELKIMCLATKLVEKVCTPKMNLRQRLRAGFDYMIKDCPEYSSRTFRYYTGWHRPFAEDIFVRGGGDCTSFGCAYAYYANAAGAKNAAIAGSGGHFWSRVNNQVYDPEFSKGRADVFALDYSQSGGGLPGYKGAETYIVKISPRTTKWGGKVIKTKTVKNGFVTTDGKRYYYVQGKKQKSKWMTINGKRYYFKSSGAAATYSTTIKGVTYLFSAKGVLQTGDKERDVTLGSATYRVKANGAVVKGFNAAKTKYYLSTGELLTGVRMVNGKPMAASESGKYNASKTAELRSLYKEGEQAEAFLKAMGDPKKFRKSPSCSGWNIDGIWYDASYDGVYTYDHLTVNTLFIDGHGEILANAV